MQLYSYRREGYSTSPGSLPTARLSVSPINPIPFWPVMRQETLAVGFRGVVPGATFLLSRLGFLPLLLWSSILQGAHPQALSSSRLHPPGPTHQAPFTRPCLPHSVYQTLSSRPHSPDPHPPDPLLLSFVVNCLWSSASRYSWFSGPHLPLCFPCMALSAP